MKVQRAVFITCCRSDDESPWLFHYLLYVWRWKPRTVFITCCTSGDYSQEDCFQSLHVVGWKSRTVFITYCRSDDESPGLFSLHAVGLIMKVQDCFHYMLQVWRWKSRTVFITCSRSDNESQEDCFHSLPVVGLKMKVKRTLPQTAKIRTICHWGPNWRSAMAVAGTRKFMKPR